MSQLYIGYDEIDITPLNTVEMVGFGRQDEQSRGVKSPLVAQITVWDSGEDKCCMIAIDHIGFSREHADGLRSQVGEQLHITKEQVMLCFSHTHSGPNESVEREYYTSVCKKIVDGVIRAANNRIPVQIGWGNGQVDIGINRRYDRQWLDNRLGLVRIQEAKTEKLVLLLLRLTAHGNVLKADNYLISPDYFGMVREVLEEEYQCKVVVTQGAAGNVAPKYYQSTINPPDACDDRFIRSKTALMDMAQEVLRAVMQMMSNIVLEPESGIQMYSTYLDLYSNVPSYEEALKVASDAKQYCGIDGAGWLQEVQRLNKEEIQEQIERVEVQFFQLGDGCLCGVANEIMCEFALEVSKQLGNDLIYFGGYTNGCTGYFPTAEEFDKGGYEVYWSLLIFYIYHGRVYPLRREAWEELVSFVVDTIRKSS